MMVAGTKLFHYFFSHDSMHKGVAETDLVKGWDSSFNIKLVIHRDAASACRTVTTGVRGFLFFNCFKAEPMRKMKST